MIPVDGLYEEAVLGHREGMVAGGLAVPAGDPGKPMGDVLDLDIEGRRIEQIKTAPAQHTLPSACPSLGEKSVHALRNSSAADRGKHSRNRCIMALISLFFCRVRTNQHSHPGDSHGKAAQILACAQ